MINVKNKPVFHKEIKIGTRVRVMPDCIDGMSGIKGEVEGVSFKNVFFIYIVRLDDSIKDSDCGMCKSVCIPGTMLEGEDGTSFKN